MRFLSTILTVCLVGVPAVLAQGGDSGKYVITLRISRHRLLLLMTRYRDWRWLPIR